MDSIFMFGGQGSQKAGMGLDFFDKYEICRETFAQASNALDLDMEKLCFEKNDLLNQTEYAQPALLTVGMAIFRVMVQEGLTPKMLMGLSLGEYTALAAADAIGFADALRLVRKRGLLMAAHGRPGGMAAVMGIKPDALADICEAAKPHGFAACANFNTPEQIVIAGEAAALSFCGEQIKAAGGKFIPLKVAGPYHSPLMADAAAEFRKELDTIDFAEPKIPIISNLDANLARHTNLSQSDLPQRLQDHITSPVRWEQSIRRTIELGCTHFIEIGSNTLCAMVNKTDPGAKTTAITKPEDIANL